MKILQINSVCGFGSTGRIATDLYKVYEEDGHECVIAYGRGNAPEGYNTIKIGSNIDNYMHVAKTRIFDKHGFGSKKATEKFIQDVKKLNPDVIHLHNIHGYYINIEILFNYLKEANKKVIWTLHDCWSFTGHCAYFDYVGCDKWKSGCEKCPQRKEYPTSNIMDNSKFIYEKKKELFTGIKDMTIITPSKWLAGLVKESFLKNYKVEVIHNGIDLEVFKPTPSDFRERYGIGNKKIILGVASIWDRRKGLNYFVDLAKELDENYQIVIVGVTEKQKKELPKNIIAITRTNNIQELVKIYSVADIFLNPSEEEAMGLVTIEALACGIPVIVNNSTAHPELINEKCGQIFNKKDYIQNILNKIINLDKKDCINKASNYNKKDKYKIYKNLLKVHKGS